LERLQVWTLEINLTATNGRGVTGVDDAGEQGNDGCLMLPCPCQASATKILWPAAIGAPELAFQGA
jgi:hypothetical protein